jgi:putative transposase
MRMGRPRKVRPDWNELATIWTISDELWDVIAPILAEGDPPKRTGRPRVDARRTLDAILFRMRSGCQWNQLPERFPDDSSVHRTFQRWVRLGLFECIGGALVQACEELGGVAWEWQAADAMLGTARLGGISSAAIRPIAAPAG